MYARIGRYEVEPDKIVEAEEIARKALPFVRKVPGIKSYTHVMNDDGRGVVVAIYENKAAAGAAAPLVQQFWLRFSPVLLAQPRLEEFSAVWALEAYS
jgi:quinol monooxygenase YgiN